LLSCCQWFSFLGGFTSATVWFAALVVIEVFFQTQASVLDVSQLSMTTPNQPDAANPAVALRLTIHDQWRRAADLERSAVKESRWS